MREDMKSCAFALVLAAVCVACGGGGKKPPPSGHFTLTLEIENASHDERICSLTYAIGPDIGSIVAAEMLAPGEVRVGEMEIAHGVDVKVTASCWSHSGGENDYRASVTKYTAPMTADMTCHAFYTQDETNTANVSFPCWH